MSPSRTEAKLGWVTTSLLVGTFENRANFSAPIASVQQLVHRSLSSFPWDSSNEIRERQAYDVPARVRRYDADMDVMHPLRWKMIEVALEILPFEPDSEISALDLGVGTGAFTKEVLTKYSRSRVIAIDGAEAMFDLARSRLGELGQRVDWILADFRSIPSDVFEANKFDLVFSSYALHHLNADEKCALLKSAATSLKPGGWFINADLLQAEDESIGAQFSRLRVAGVTARADNDDERFRTEASTRDFLTKLQTDEHDQPQTLTDEVDTLRRAGFPKPVVVWREYREAVIAAIKQ